MIKSKRKKEPNNNLRLGLYFGIVVFFIIFVSVTFRIFDSIKKSTFNGQDTYTVAVFTKSKLHLITVSPKEGNLKALTLTNLKNEEALRSLSIPYDNKAISSQEVELNPKTYFEKILFRQNDLESNLTTIDLIKLIFYSKKIGDDKVEKRTIAAGDEEISATVSDWFLDQEIVNEGINIEIINSTEVPGLGNKYADLITNKGGNVVLVHSFQDETAKSVIYYKEDSYTVDKLSKLLGIPKEKKEDMNAVSEIIVQVGSDKKDY